MRAVTASFRFCSVLLFLVIRSSRSSFSWLFFPVIQSCFKHWSAVNLCSGFRLIVRFMKSLAFLLIGCLWHTVQIPRATQFVGTSASASSCHRSLECQFSGKKGASRWKTCCKLSLPGPKCLQASINPLSYLTVFTFLDDLRGHVEEGAAVLAQRLVLKVDFGRKPEIDDYNTDFAIGPADHDVFWVTMKVYQASSPDGQCPCNGDKLVHREFILWSSEFRSLQC